MAGRNDGSRNQRSSLLVVVPFTLARLRGSARYRLDVRILMLTWEFPPAETGGVGAHVRGLSRALTVSGHDVVIFTIQTDDTIDQDVLDGVRIRRARVDLPWLADDDLVAVASSGNHHLVSLIAQLGEWRPDIVHGHDWRTAWASSTLADIFGVPLVTTIHSTEQGRHGSHIPDGDPMSIHSVESWMANISQRVICCSRFMQREIIDGFELMPDSVALIPNGVDVAEWAPVTEHDRETLVLAWGRVQYEKGFQVLAQAIGRLRGRVPGIRCVIAGRGPYLPELQSQVDIEGVSDLVQLAGYVTNEELRDLLHRAGCVVIPSLYEPFGIVALESLAADAPTVVARTGGLAEIMEGSAAGLMFEPGNAKQLATAIEQVLLNNQVAQDLRRHGATVLNERYSWAAIAQSTLTVYQSL